MNFSVKYIFSALLATLQVFCCLYVFAQFDFEPQAGVKESIPLILSFFLISTIVPDRFRLWTYNLLFVTLLFFAFGLLVSGIIIFVLFCVIYWLRSPVSNTIKLAGIFVLLATLLLIRLNLVYAPRLNLAATYIGVILMFRVFSLLYYKKFEPALLTSLDKEFAYLLVFPNLLFLIFPIIDFKKYSQSFDIVPRESTWQKGVRWMLRGITHLFMYRVFYHYLSISPGEVMDLASLVRYCAGAYLLILRITGIFHFSLGLICLFGFNLPEIFNNFLLAENLPDIWRRVNIYWREYMQKLFFHPIYMKVRKRTGMYAILIASLMVFVLSYLLHNYQWLWIRGGVTFKLNDFLFWIILGVVVSTTVFIKQQQNTFVSLNVDSNWRKLFFRSLKILGCFFLMSLLWSLWNCESISEWFYLMSYFSKTNVVSLIKLSFVGLFLLLLLMVLLKGHEKYNLLNDPINPERLKILNIGIILLFIGLLFSVKFVESKDHALKVLFYESKNTFEKELSERGYYKTLIEGDRTSIQALWEVPIKVPLANYEIKELIEPTKDLYGRKLIPGKSYSKNGIQIKINAHGMRDKEYKLVSLSESSRIALLGGSYEMGSGVSDGENFESLVEAKFAQKDSLKVELLNFSVGAYKLIQNIKQAQEITPDFHPKYIVYFSHNSDKTRILNQFTDYIQNGTDLEYPELITIKKLSGVKQSMSEVEIRKRLSPYMDQVMEWGYRSLATAIREQQAIPVWVYMPVLNENEVVTENLELYQLAVKNDFLCYSMANAFTSYSKESIEQLMMTRENAHPNRKGHVLLAKEFERIVEDLIKTKRNN